MRVLVIGAGGFVGSGAARRLAAGGHEVHALARDPAKAAAFEAHGYKAVNGAFGGPELLAALDEVDGVVNCSAVGFEEWPFVEPILERLAGSHKPFVQTTGTGVLSIETPQGEWREETFAEDDPFTPPPWIAVRTVTETKVREAAAKGVRPWSCARR